MEADDLIMKIVWSSEIGTMILNEIITTDRSSRFNWNGNFQGEETIDVVKYW